jgi:hypothetical protein
MCKARLSETVVRESGEISSQRGGFAGVSCGLLIAELGAA